MPPEDVPLGLEANRSQAMQNQKGYPYLPFQYNSQKGQPKNSARLQHAARRSRIGQFSNLTSHLYLIYLTFYFSQLHQVPLLTCALSRFKSDNKSLFLDFFRF